MSTDGIFFGCRGLVKRYHDVTRVLTVLDGAALELAPGEMIAVVGKSGTGKSTLLHLLGLLDTPDKGSVFYEGREVSTLAARERDALRNRAFGFIFQSYHLLPEFTALENVLMPAMMCPLARWRAKRREAAAFARELLERVSLADRAEHRPDQLSGGEQQRVAIARALVNSPAVILADEPTGNLDTDTAAEVQALLAGLVRDRGASAVVVTHDASLAARADRVLDIDNGRLKERRTASDQ